MHMLTAESARHSLRLDYLAGISAERASAVAAELVARAYARASGAVAAAQGQSEAMAVSGAAAGLVYTKTTPNLDQPPKHYLSMHETEKALRRISALRRSVRLDSLLLDLQHKPRGLQSWLVTLTYRGVDDWRPDHATRAIERYRRWCKSHGYECIYVWVAELQSRGAVHYHLIAYLPQGVRMPFWDRPPSSRAKAFWSHGMTNVEQARNPVGYLTKYLSKMGKYHQFPRGCRTHGFGGLTDTHLREIRSWSNLPYWVRQRYMPHEVKRKRGRLLDTTTGEYLPAVYKAQLCTVNGVALCMRFEQVMGLDPPIYDGPACPISGYTNSE